MLWFLDHTEVEPAANLAVDEAILEWVDESLVDDPPEVLRLWTPAAPFVVIGRASRLTEEVAETVCQQRGIPILRRGSGGTAIVTGPGCLMYAVVLSLKRRPELRMIDAAHQFVLSHLANALTRCGVPAQCAGTSDVSAGGRKISGNSLRIRRDALLYHGTVLLDLDLSLLNCLSQDPPRQPEYRKGRDHTNFVHNLKLPIHQVKTAMREVWRAEQELLEWPKLRTFELVRERFGRHEWTFQR